MDDLLLVPTKLPHGLATENERQLPIYNLRALESLPVMHPDRGFRLGL